MYQEVQSRTARYSNVAREMIRKCFFSCSSMLLNADDVLCDDDDYDDNDNNKVVMIPISF